jgi:hypothetical protein
MGYWLDSQDSSPAKERIFSLLHAVQAASGVHPASCLMDTKVIFVREEQPEYKAYHY